MIIDPFKLEEILRPIAKSLGLRVKVTYNDSKSGYPFSYCLDTALIPPARETYTVDEEMFMPRYNRLVNAKGEEIGGPVSGQEVTELLIQLLRDMQLKLHDKTREQMDKLDCRERVVKLSRDEQHTLHDMLCSIEVAEMSRFKYGGPQEAAQIPSRIDKFRALVGKLMR